VQVWSVVFTIPHSSSGRDLGEENIGRIQEARVGLFGGVRGLWGVEEGSVGKVRVNFDHPLQGVGLSRLWAGKIEDPCAAGGKVCSRSQYRR
jgi:hypothetical protein